VTGVRRRKRQASNGMMTTDRHHLQLTHTHATGWRTSSMLSYLVYDLYVRITSHIVDSTMRAAHNESNVCSQNVSDYVVKLER
jgi:hypothetical protein